MARFAFDFSKLPANLREPLMRKWKEVDARKRSEAHDRQKLIHRLYNAAAVPGATKDGFGPCAMAMDPYFVSYFRREYGEQIFQDPEFIEWLKREGEYFHVHEAGTKTQIGFRGNSRNRAGFRGKIVCGPATSQAVAGRAPVPVIVDSGPRTVRFHKAYAPAT